MNFTEEKIKSYLEQLQASLDIRETLIHSLKNFGFSVSKFDNGSLFALSLGDVPSKEGSVFVTSMQDLPAVAALFAVMDFINQKRAYKDRVHHPDIELVFLNDWSQAAMPDFQKIYAPNAYLLEKPRPIGTLFAATDEIVKDRYNLVINGLGNHYEESSELPSEIYQIFATQQIRTASISYGMDEKEYTKNADILLYLAVAYQE